MAIARDRTRTLPTVSGSRTLYGVTKFYTRANGSERCIDVSGNFDTDNGLLITRKTHQGGRLSGERHDSLSGSAPYAVWADQPFSINVSGFDPPAKKFNSQTAALKAYNMTNPSRHDIGIVSSVVELRDLPHMLKFAGRILKGGPELFETLKNYLLVKNGVRGVFATRRALDPKALLLLKLKNLSLEQQGGLSAAKALAAANLAWQFGWAPILRDIDQLVGFGSAVDRRAKEIDQLYSGRGMKRDIHLQDDRNRVSYVITADSTAGILDVPIVAEVRTRIWAVTRWKPKDKHALPPSRQDIMRTMLGLDPHGITMAAWELFPWSWLAGWCSNIDEYLRVSSNAMNAAGSVVVMVHQSKKITSFDTTVTYSGDTGFKSASAYTFVEESLARNVGIPGLEGLSASIPILGDGQLSILNSIAMLKGLR